MVWQVVQILTTDERSSSSSQYACKQTRAILQGNLDISHSGKLNICVFALLRGKSNLPSVSCVHYKLIKSGLYIYAIYYYFKQRLAC